jgi:hypothetical protein
MRQSSRISDRRSGTKKTPKTQTTASNDSSAKRVARMSA